MDYIEQPVYGDLSALDYRSDDIPIIDLQFAQPDNTDAKYKYFHEMSCLTPENTKLQPNTMLFAIMIEYSTPNMYTAWCITPWYMIEKHAWTRAAVKIADLAKNNRHPTHAWLVKGRLIDKSEDN